MIQRSLYGVESDWTRSCHVLSIRWKDFTPHLVCRSLETNEINDHQLMGNVAILVSLDKRCIGKWVGNEHIPCPEKVRVKRFHRCDECAGEIIPDQNCIFEPRCDGISCLVIGRSGERISFCNRPHVVYIAFYGNRPKIGMTSEGRVRERCIEQGADAYMVISRHENRYDARWEEKRLSRQHSIRQSFSAGEVLRMTVSKVDRDTIHSSAIDILNMMQEHEKGTNQEVVQLTEYPIELPLRSTPRETTAGGIHIGKIIGVKGRFMYYESPGLSALNVYELTSRTLNFKTTIVQ